MSVVVVAWQARDHVLACLESLRRHAGLAHEVIVVDDGSVDGTVEAVRKRFPAAIVVAKQRNEGLAAGRNDGVKLVRGRYVLMLDADTMVHEGALPALVEALARRPDAGVVGPRLVYPDGSLQLSCRRWPPVLLPFLRRGPYAWVNPNPRAHRLHMMEDFDHATERPVVWVMGAAQMYRAGLPEVVGAYDRRVSSYGGEDFDWCVRVWAAGFEVVYVPAAQVTHAFQKVIRRRKLGRKSLRALRDHYYLQLKHLRIRRSGVLARALR